MRSNELPEEPPFGDSALARFGRGAENPCGLAPAYVVNTLAFMPIVRRVGDLLRPSTLIFPPLFPNGDLDLAGEKGEADVKGEVDPAKASNPVRLVAVLGVTGCGVCDDGNTAANDDRLNGEVKWAWTGVVSRGNGTCFTDEDVVDF